MVDIKQSDFNKDLDNYLVERRTAEKIPKKRKSFALFKRRKKKSLEEEIPEEVVEEMEEIEEEIKELDEDIEDEYDYQKREGLLTKFFRLLRSNKTDEEEMMDIGLDEETKEVLKISFIWLNKLPPAKMREFKASGDFELCKDLLIKHGLAKEK